MKLNLSRLVLTAGLSLGMISIVSVAQARIQLNGSSLTGQKTEKPPPQQLKGTSEMNSRLTGQTSEKQPSQ